jgi:hypothetical protein
MLPNSGLTSSPMQRCSITSSRVQFARAERSMTSLPAVRTLLHPADAKLLRVSLTYVVPALVVFYAIFSGLWLVSDIEVGMYGNHDGHWLSWNTRGILEWSGFLDFSPFSPLVGTGSLFAPYLPWLNPGAVALAIPAPLPLRHLASMLVYLAELSASLYLLYRHLEFSREHSFVAALLYLCIFFIPFNGLTLALPWYALAPENAHLIASMNVATIALIRVGYGELFSRLAFALVLFLALFIAFVSGPVHSMTYIPIYGTLWMAFLVPFRAQRSAVLWRWGTMAFALLMLGLIGVPSYLAATAMTSARSNTMPPMFHPGRSLLSPAYWHALVSNFPACSPHMQLMCWSSVVGLFEIAVLVGAGYLVFAGSGTQRRYGLAIIVLLALLHFYALLSVQAILGWVHTISTPYLMWAFFPLAAPAAIAAVSFAVGGRRAASAVWALAATSWLIAIGAAFAPGLPRLSPHARRSLPPIAHVPVNKGPIVDYLQRQIGVNPGGKFRGYASTYLGASDGLVRKLSATPVDSMTWDAYVAARVILFERFGNSFQMMDLWNSSIPTFEEYGQWTSKQMYAINRDLLSERQDQVDPLMNSILLYRFRPLFLRALGVRFVIADGTLTHPAVEHIMSEPGKAGARINLYEIKGANLGQFSPTHVTWAADYPTAVRALREAPDFEHRVLLLGAPERKPDLVAADASRLVTLRDGYQLTASAPGVAMLVLPVQFSHCWRIDPDRDDEASEAPQLVRANVVQTGILFKGKLDVRLRFDFEPWRTICRFRDGEDLSQFGVK